MQHCVQDCASAQVSVPQDGVWLVWYGTETPLMEQGKRKTLQNMICTQDCASDCRTQVACYTGQLMKQLFEKQKLDYGTALHKSKAATQNDWPAHHYYLHSCTPFSKRSADKIHLPLEIICDGSGWNSPRGRDAQNHNTREQRTFVVCRTRLTPQRMRCCKTSLRSSLCEAYSQGVPSSKGYMAPLGGTVAYSSIAHRTPSVWKDAPPSRSRL